MIAYRVVTQYGKNKKFYRSECVTEDMLEWYKEKITKEIRGWSWKKEIHFWLYKRYELAEDGHGIGEIAAWTAHGFDWNVRVK